MLLKQLLRALIVILILLVSSCKKKNVDPCYIESGGVIDCIGFPSLAFVITRNGENIFKKNTATIQDINLQGTDAANGELKLYSEYDTINGPILSFLDADWELAGSHNYVINVEDSNSFSLATTFTISEGACCGRIPVLEQIQINDIQATPNSETGFYTIALD